MRHTGSTQGRHAGLPIREEGLSPREDAELRNQLRILFQLQARGSAFPRLSHAQGMVDGYMTALLTEGRVTQRELLRVVAEERLRSRGPAVGAVRSEGDSLDELIAVA